MPSIPPPTSFANVQGTLGFAYVFAAQEIERELRDMLDVHGLGIIPLKGDLRGTGSDTVRVTDFGNVGWDLPMKALSTETEEVVPSPIDVGFSTVVIAPHGLAQSETYQHQILGREAAIMLDRLKPLVVRSWLRTFRDKVCITGSQISTKVGSAATTLSVDDHLDLATVWRVNLGNRKPFAMIDGTQFDELARSWRNEPAFQNSPEALASLLALEEGDNGVITQKHPNYALQNIDLFVTDSIVQAAGARQGFAVPIGGIGWAVANTMPVRPANSVGFVNIAPFGLIIEELTGGGRQTTREYRATAYLGTALAREETHTQRGFISQI